MKKILLTMLSALLTQAQADQQYNTISKEPANSATFSFVSDDKKWGEIIKLTRPLAEEGFFYFTIQYKDQSFTISASAREVTLVVSGEERLEEPAARSSIYLGEDGFLYITAPENPDDKAFLSDLQKIAPDSYHIVIKFHANMSLEQIFQVMDHLSSHISIDTILVTRNLTQAEIDRPRRFQLPPDIESPSFGFGSPQNVQEAEAGK